MAAVTADGATLRLRFAAAFGRSADGGSAGYLRPVELLFQDAIWRGDDTALCVGGIAQGSLHLDGRPVGPVAQILPLPFEGVGQVICEFRLISGTALRIEAGAVRARPGVDATFRESFAC